MVRGNDSILESDTDDSFEINVFPASGKGPSIRVSARFDQDMPQNLISRRRAEKTKARIVSNDQTQTIQDSTGTSYNSAAGVELRWYESDHPNSIISNFSVVDQASLQDVDVVLGAEALDRLHLNGEKWPELHMIALSRLNPEQKRKQDEDRERKEEEREREREELARQEREARDRERNGNEGKEVVTGQEVVPAQGHA